MSENSNALANGSVLKGKLDYTIESCLGQGGFGITYLAKGTMQIGNIKHSLMFTIKEFFMQYACSRQADGSMAVTAGNDESVSEHKKSFLKEAERLHSLSEHPGIVSVNEVFSQNNTVYYVMEYLGDVNLGSYISQHGGRLDEKEATRIFRLMAEALQYLHSKKIMHLDVKPANVMMKQDAESDSQLPVLIDFGLALHFGRSNNPTSENKTICCTDGFSPQEQYLGISTFEPSADIYALGATVLYMLSGKTPPMANKMNDLYVDNTISSNVSPELRAIIKKCMARLPEHRFKSMDEVLEQLSNRDAQPYYDLGGGTTQIIGQKKPKTAKTDGGKAPAWVKPALMVVCGAVLCAVIVIVALSVMGGEATGNDEEVVVEDTTTSVTTPPAEEVSEDKTNDTAQAEEKNVEEKKAEEKKAEEKREVKKEVATPAPEEAGEATIDLGYAVYVGEVQGGKPHGFGTLSFKIEHQIESYDAAGNVAEAGDKVTGTFNAGHLTKGRWKKSNGETQTLIIGN